MQFRTKLISYICNANRLDTKYLRRLSSFRYSVNEFQRESTRSDSSSPKSGHSRWTRLAVSIAGLGLASTLLDDRRRVIFAKEKGPSKRDEFNFIADVVEQVLPSIVSIEVVEKLNLFHGFAFGRNDRSRRPDSEPATVTTASGSGFIVDSKRGLIITNAHVVRSYNSKLNVKLNHGRSISGRVILIDRKTDLAIVQIDPISDLKQVKMGDSNQVRTGEFVIALGSPLALSNTVTSGVVSNPSRNGIELGMNNDLSYIQTDSIVTHGNSGGPLVNLDGECIGINSMTATPGISFAIPSKFALNLINSLDGSSSSKKTIMASKQTTRKSPFLGMKVITVSKQIVNLFNVTPWSDIKLPADLQAGSLIIDVSPNSPADRAGLKRGDVIASVNSVAIIRNEELFEQIKQSKSDLKLVILRNNKEILLDIKLDD